MLEIIIPKNELFNEATNEFIEIPETKLILEHSLISIKKWESKHHVPFLGNRELSSKETLDYIKCMAINKVDDKVFEYLTDESIKKIVEYIKDPMTATWFSNNGENNKLGTGKKEVITNETIYYNMIMLGIPMEFQKWHLNQLLTLIKFVNVKQQKNKKMTKKQEMTQRNALNAQRRARLGSKG